MAYGTPSKVLAGVLSPWVLLVVGVGLLGLLYQFYYKPRLFYTYCSYPPSPQVYLLPSYGRRREFTRDPAAYLWKASASLGSRSNVFWVDALRGYDRKTVTILGNTNLILQFLTTDDRDNLSWDAPVSYAWQHIFDRSSPFGNESKFYSASRYCLIHGFSLARTTTLSIYGKATIEAAETTLHEFKEGDLNVLVSGIVRQALLQIFFGSSLGSDLRDILRDLSLSLTSNSISKKSTKKLSAAFISRVSDEVRQRLDDLESTGGHGDYLQWLLTNRPQMDTHSTPAKSPEDTTSDLLDESLRTIPEDPPETTSPGSKQRHEEHLRRDLPEHLLSTYLQTHLLVTNCVVWAVLSNAMLDNSFSPDPLLLVRKTRKEILLGSTVIPKDCYVAMSPVLEKRKANSAYNPVYSEGQQATSTTELSNLSAMNSVLDLNESTYSDSHLSSVHQSPSFGSFSPLLQGRYPSTPSTNGSSEETRVNPEVEYRSKKGSWVRRYPQGHLISLLVGAVTRTIGNKLVVIEPSRPKVKYGGARSLWLPLLAAPVTVSKTSTDAVTKPLASFRVQERQNSSTLSYQS